MRYDFGIEWAIFPESQLWAVFRFETEKCNFCFIIAFKQFGVEILNGIAQKNSSIVVQVDQSIKPHKTMTEFRFCFSDGRSILTLNLNNQLIT